jgi:hypothetical protein
VATSKVSALLPHPVERVWRTVTDLEDTAWRSDLSRVERLSPTRFAEYGKNGGATIFNVTVREPPRRWAFTMENGNMSGCWLGEFEPSGEGCRLTFTETVTAKHWWMVPFVPGYLKHQQKVYLSDLRRKLAEVSPGSAGV